MNALALRLVAAEPDNSADTARLLDLLAPGEPVTFQTFDDTKRHRRELVQILHGTLAEYAATLAKLNAQGAGVFFVVNATDGEGRKASNVKRVRALFVDLDGAPLEPVKTANLQPHCIVQTSPGRWHAYWRIADCPPEQFTPLQKALAARFNADPKVCDLPRVMRLPGFEHCKHGRYRSHIVEVHERGPYTVAEVVQAFGLYAAETPAPVASVAPPRARKLAARIVEGERNSTLLSLAAGFVSKGYSLTQVNKRLQRINAERCQPPLCATEVDSIVVQAVKYGSEGFAALLHKLLDSPEWLALPPPAHDVIVTAFRRYDGTNNGDISLTWTDFEGREGFGGKHAFYQHRKRAVAAGILYQASKGGNGQTGRKPDLFGIVPKWLRNSASVQK